MSDVAKDFLVSLGFEIDREPLDQTIERSQILVGLLPSLERLKALGVHVDMRVTEEIVVGGPVVVEAVPSHAFGPDYLPS